MKRCNTCIICPFINEVKSVRGDKFIWKIQGNLNCQTDNVVYMIKCKKDNCQMQYIGETERKAKKRINEHVGYVRNMNIKQPVGYHFNLPGHD